jgi:hypothetical protein
MSEARGGGSFVVNNGLLGRGARTELIARGSHEGTTREPNGLSAALDVLGHAMMRSGQRPYADTEGDNRPIPEMPSRSFINEFSISQGTSSQATA